MKLASVLTTVFAVFATVALMGGCSVNSNAPSAASSASSGNGPSGHDHESEDEHAGHDHDDEHAGHDHENEHEGPHRGHVIELGRSHEYHAELVEDESGNSVSVFILDKEMKELAVDTTSITMNLMVDGKPKSFELSAAVVGKNARFDAEGKSLFEALHTHQATGKLRVTIGGTPYSGDVEHHDHEGHKH